MQYFGRGTKVFIAEITGNVTVISNRRWKYTWGKSRLQASDKTFVFETSPLTYTNTLIYAYNACEALQQASGTYDGPGITHANIPAGYLLKPIKNGTNVLMLQSRDDLGNVTFVFSLANAIDGACG